MENANELKQSLSDLALSFKSAMSYGAGKSQVATMIPT